MLSKLLISLSLLILSSAAVAAEHNVTVKTRMQIISGDRVSSFNREPIDNLGAAFSDRIVFDNTFTGVVEACIQKIGDDSKYKASVSHLFLRADVNNDWAMLAGRIRFSYGMYPEEDAIFSTTNVPVRPQSVYRPALEDVGHAAEGVQLRYGSDHVFVNVTHGMMVSRNPQEFAGVFYAVPNIATFDIPRSKISALNIAYRSDMRFDIAFDTVYSDIAVVPNPANFLAGTQHQTLTVNILSVKYYTDYDIDFIAERMVTHSGGDTWKRYTDYTAKVKGEGWSIGAIKTADKWNLGWYVDRFDAAPDIYEIQRVTGRDLKNLYSLSHSVYGTYKFSKTSYINVQRIHRVGSATESPVNSGSVESTSTIFQWLNLF